MERTKKCSALLAASAGAAVCLSGGPAFAVSGTTGPTIAPMAYAPMFGGAIVMANYVGVMLGGYTLTNSIQVALVGTYVATYGPGVDCATGVFANYGKALPGGPDRFIKIKFNNGTQYYGWSQFTKTGTNYEFGAWSYDAEGNNIWTLADSVTASKLGLSDGREKLVWSNANEEGVARYEVQAKDASGAWHAVSSEAPGAGMYSVAVPAGSECRVVVEKVDGTAENIGF